MPWPRNSDLPAAVHSAGYSEDCLTAFRKAANSALDRGEDDGTAMRIGHTAAKACMKANGMMNRRIRGGA